MHKEFTLPNELTIYTAAETRAGLLAWLQEHAKASTPVRRVLASQVDDLDGAGLQLLAALANALEGDDLMLEIVAPPALMLEACDILGCRDWFTFTALQEAA